MTSREFRAILTDAGRGPITTDWDEVQEHLRPFDGCALHGRRILATRSECVTMVRYQAMQFNGLWDHAELEQLRQIARRVDLI